jgi:hypothetical protein
MGKNKIQDLVNIPMNKDHTQQGQSMGLEELIGKIINLIPMHLVLVNMI